MRSLTLSPIDVVRAPLSCGIRSCNWSSYVGCHCKGVSRFGLPSYLSWESAARMVRRFVVPVHRSEREFIRICTSRCPLVLGIEDWHDPGGIPGPRSRVVLHAFLGLGHLGLSLVLSLLWPEAKKVRVWSVGQMRTHEDACYGYVWAVEAVCGGL